jgi:hypothetical protein
MLRLGRRSRILAARLTASATRPEAADVKSKKPDACYSSCRTCEIGMTRAHGAGVPVVSLSAGARHALIPPRVAGLLRLRANRNHHLPAPSLSTPFGLELPDNKVNQIRCLSDKHRQSVDRRVGF